MASPTLNSDDDCLLEDDNVKHLQPPLEHLSAGLVSSPTTDTLDSVALEPSPSDDAVVEEDSDNQGMIESVDLGQGSQLNIAENVDGKDVIILPPEDTDASQNAPAEADAGKKDSNEANPGQKEDGSTNISSYFVNSGDDFFDSFGGEVQDSKLGSDLFTSIAISKSEEDIRASEMNATEIDTSAISGDNLSPEDEERRRMSRVESFPNVEEVSPSTEGVASKPESGDEDKVNEKEEENVTRIHHREHTTSTSEPETIAFEGVGEAVESEQAHISEIAALALGDKGEFEEFMAQGEEDPSKPSFLSQISHTSEHSESSVGVSGAAGSQQPTPGVLNPPADSARLQGPVVGTTPSQLSPMGTPIHSVSEGQEMLEPVAPPTPSSNPSVFETQTSVPGSPFQTTQDRPSDSVFPSFGGSGQSDDAFTSILSMSDSDRRHDAWIPSDATRHILVSMATSTPGSYLPSIEQLSTPGILSNEPQSDPVRDLVLRYMGEQEAVKRSVLTVDSVTQDVDGLKKLIEAGCLRAAIELTGRLLEQVGQGFGKAGQVTVHTPHSLQLWFCRLTLMVKLRMYEAAEAEMRAFQTLDTPDLYFQYYANSYPGRRGSMVSFSMRLLHAELPLLSGRSQETLDRLYYMLAVCSRIKSNLSLELSEDGSATHMTYEARKVSQELWNQREMDINYKIGSTMLAVKDYEGALAIYSELLDKEQIAKLELKAGLGRIHLQMGNISEATRIMKEVEAETMKDNSMSCFNLLAKGLVAMSANNFYDAYQHFKSAVQLQPHNTCAVNNMAVCSLYLGRLKDALNTLEQLVHSDPANTLHEGVLFNLCTLYELETSRALHKKQAILDLVSKHKGDGFPVACLKMT